MSFLVFLIPPPLSYNKFVLFASFILGASPQAQRDKASKLFHDSTNVVLFTSDVTARGLDYPDVTAVIQVFFMMTEKTSLLPGSRVVYGTCGE